MRRLVKLISRGLFAFGMFVGTYGWCLVQMKNKSWMDSSPILCAGICLVALLTCAVLDESA